MRDIKITQGLITHLKERLPKTYCFRVGSDTWCIKGKVEPKKYILWLDAGSGDSGKHIYGTTLKSFIKDVEKELIERGL